MSKVICKPTHIVDLTRMASSTSPYLFQEETEKNHELIKENLNTNPFACFIRKIHSEFPDQVLLYYIDHYSIKNINMRYILIINFFYKYFNYFIGLSLIVGLLLIINY